MSNLADDTLMRRVKIQGIAFLLLTLCGQFSTSIAAEFAQVLVDATFTLEDSQAPIKREIGAVRRLSKPGEPLAVHPDWCLLTFDRPQPEWTHWLQVTPICMVRGNWLVEYRQVDSVRGHESDRRHFRLVKQGESFEVPCNIGLGRPTKVTARVLVFGVRSPSADGTPDGASSNTI